jgi:hypothetical protein
MKALLTLATVLVLCAPAVADVVPTSVLIKPLFDKSDLVCNCSVKSIAVVEERSENSVVRRRLRASIETNDLYKSHGSDAGSIVVDYVQNIPSTSASQPTLSKGETGLLFLKATGPATYEFADPFFGAIPFNYLPRQSGQAGIKKLQSALAVVAQRPNRDDRIRALRLLYGFDDLDPGTVSSIVALSSSEDPEIAFPALAVLLKAKSPESVQKLKSYLDAYKGEAETLSLMDIGTQLGQVRDMRALPAVEALSGSRFVAVRYGAMDAMRGMKLTKSAPTLVQRLDSPDRFTQYLAVITLAEIFGKYGDYAPGMELFDKNPRRYTELWKKWWAEQGPQP